MDTVAPSPINYMSCPVDHGKKADACPVDHSKYTKNDKLNPLNNMPELGQEMWEGQSIQLSTERELSNIPKDSSQSIEKWEYPSPQVRLSLSLTHMHLAIL
jgi:cytochrome c heme-lyase